MNLYESIKSGSLKEAQITDYIDKNKLANIIKKNSILGKVTKSFRCLDNMILEVTTDSGVSLYKVVNTPDGLEAYWVDRSGKQLADPFLLTESSFEPTEEDIEEMNHWYCDDPREDWDAGRTNDYYNVCGFDKEKELEKLHEKDLWMSQEDTDWLKGQGHKKALDEILDNYSSTGDSEKDEINLNNLASDYFYDKAGIYNENIDSLCSKWAHDEANKLNESSLNSSTYTDIVRNIDDVCSEELDEKEIQIFLQNIIGHCRDLAESFNVLVESDVDYYKILTEEELTEAPNPENAEANELIKKALADRQFAIDNAKELEKHGIKVDVDYYSGTNSKGEHDIKSVHLTGSNGRKLQCKEARWHDFNWNGTSDYKPNKEAYYKDGINKWNPETRDYENVKKLDDDFTLDAKSYKDSKDRLSKVKEELPTLKRRLNLYERRYGKDSMQYRELAYQIKTDEEILKKGIRPQYSKNTSKDIDYKSYINAKIRSDRPHALTPEEEKKNSTIAQYKQAKADEQYNNRQKEWNAQRDKEEQDRIARYMKDYTDEKTRRDQITSDEDSRIKSKLDEIHKKLEDSKAKRKN